MIQKSLIAIYLIGLMLILIMVKVEDSFKSPVFNRGLEFSNLVKAETFAFKKYSKKQLVNQSYIWSDFNNGEWEDCSWNGLSLFESSAKNLNLKNCTIQNSLFLGVDFRGAVFNNVNFKDNLFVSCRFDQGFKMDQLNQNYSKAN